MKKIITIISAVVASLSLAGCSSSSTNKSNNLTRVIINLKHPQLNLSQSIILMAKRQVSVI
ncbi:MULTISPECIES: hypothetical protein [unclassified Lactobacillus]|uniref:hypothetical protein n=1 Tax=unclassified Lactobacillus TaxID=2620435 RepID=UPI000EFD856E|nr:MULTISPECIES: hypothetical protein [unclassified Lactobacillus]RMC24465.1 hypothetical protein F5ESL0247_04640 [Lactobacillus sp. ESL0247]RMC28604.1 hypothetical protein F5ESL0246_04640 [Lactobacillus sp. ESL0246]RMC31796.1 hypothetical protein F5ESL0245_04645 [Lactobacillus sp. ESL0245]